MANYFEFEGFPAPLTNGGLNEHNASACDVWANSHGELLEVTPMGQTGPSYSGMARAAMERANTASEAVEVLGDLINEHGYTIYGGNSHLIVDENAGWGFVEYAEQEATEYTPMPTSQESPQHSKASKRITSPTGRTFSRAAPWTTRAPTVTQPTCLTTRRHRRPDHRSSIPPGDPQSPESAPDAERMRGTKIHIDTIET